MLHRNCCMCMLRSLCSSRYLEQRCLSSVAKCQSAKTEEVIITIFEYSLFRELEQR